MIRFLCSQSGVLLAFANPLNESQYGPVLPLALGATGTDQRQPEESYWPAGVDPCDGDHLQGGWGVRSLMAQPSCVKLLEVIRFVIYVPDSSGTEVRVDYLFSPDGRLIAYHSFQDGTPSEVAERDLGIHRAVSRGESMSPCET
ncbi:hypothetical protein [Cupriavidus nantongensis]|uniref:hypothetical protein n=1 Tax=Cupriavidus nantongensis TaxID=1796606 RepID=UPI0012374525|nr:hypothetical protein [Cupriavidus nantongensis]